MSTDPLDPRAELRAHLQSMLAGAYAVERELGGGGMSRVFLAEETRLRRRVVIKVLPPDLAAGLLLDRFEREVTLAARLQHPNIVPVLSAGEVGGLPYFTMPFVDGQSLRSRLTSMGSGPRLPLREALGILRDVAKALAYAHGQGVVHRDIKPENVLLHGDTAVVTDFGIAKALAAAVTTQADSTEGGHGSVGGGLTAHGSWLGTPAYMAPEQALGEPVDTRADLYAWGVVAYETLSGVHPFAGLSTPQQLIAAHIGATPIDLEQAAPDVPPAVAELVMRCLTKQPSARPSSADALVSALGSVVATPHPGQPIRSRRARWPRITAASLAVLVVLGVSAFLLTPPEARTTLHTLLVRRPATLRVNRVVVAPFKDETRDAKLAALGSLVADYVTEGLSRLGSLQVVDSRTATQTTEFLSRIPRLLRPNDDRALGQETGAKVVVSGSYYLIGDSVIVRAKILDAETGAMRTAIEAAAAPAHQPATAVTAITRRVVAALRAASDEDAPDLAGLSPPPSMDAYTAFHEGYLSYVRGAPQNAVIPKLVGAMQLDSTYAAPAVLLALIDPSRRLETTGETALVHARRFSDRLTKLERALLELATANENGDPVAALAAAQQTGVPILIAIQALLVRRPHTAIAALTSTDPDRGMNIPLASLYWWRLSQAYAQIGAYDRAWTALTEGRRRSEDLRNNSFLPAAILGARGDVDGLREHLERVSRSEEHLVVATIVGTALLRMRGNKEIEGKAVAAEWAEQLLKARPDPNDDLAMMDLLGSVDRWADSRRFVELAERRVAAAEPNSNSDASSDMTAQYVRLRRAIAAIHLGQISEALSIDSGFAALERQPVTGPQFTLQRSIIAAHLGRRDDAIALLTRSVDHGGLALVGGIGTGSLYDMILLQPLLDDPRFKALAEPDPRDRP